MHCPKCGRQVPDTSKFCRHCAFDIESYKNKHFKQSESPDPTLYVKQEYNKRKSKQRVSKKTSRKRSRIFIGVFCSVFAVISAAFLIGVFVFDFNPIAINKNKSDYVIEPGCMKFEKDGYKETSTQDYNYKKDNSESEIDLGTIEMEKDIYDYADVIKEYEDKYGIADMSDITETLNYSNASDSSWSSRSGIIGYDIVDMDNDNVKDLIIYRFGSGESQTAMYFHYITLNSKGEAVEKNTERLYEEIPSCVNYTVGGILELNEKKYFYYEFCEHGSFFSDGVYRSMYIYEAGSKGLELKYKVGQDGGGSYGYTFSTCTYDSNGNETKKKYWEFTDEYSNISQNDATKDALKSLGFPSTDQTVCDIIESMGYLNYDIDLDGSSQKGKSNWYGNTPTYFDSPILDKSFHWVNLPIDCTFNREGEYTFRNTIKIYHNQCVKKEINEEYLNAYAEFLENEYDKYKSVSTVKFMLGYVDDDDIPELLYFVDGSHVAPVMYYTYYNGEVTHVLDIGSYGESRYAPRENIIAGFDLSNGIESGVYSSFNNGTEERLVTYSYQYTGGSSNYSVNNESVSADIYNQTVTNYSTSHNYIAASLSDAYEVNPSNIESLLQDPEKFMNKNEK